MCIDSNQLDRQAPAKPSVDCDRCALHHSCASNERMHGNDGARYPQATLKKLLLNSATDLVITKQNVQTLYHKNLSTNTQPACRLGAPFPRTDIRATDLIKRQYRPRMPDKPSSILDRRLLVSLIAVSTIFSKLIHIYAHYATLQLSTIPLWVPSLFYQDTVVVIAIRCLITLGPLGTALAAIAVVPAVLLAAVSATVFYTSHTELQWRHLLMATDRSTWTTLGSRATPFMACCIILLITSYAFQDLCFGVATVALEVTQRAAGRCLRLLHRLVQRSQDVCSGQDVKVTSEHCSWDTGNRSWRLSPTLRVLISLFLTLQLLCAFFRPSDSSMDYLSWTLLLQPLVQILRPADTLRTMTSSTISGSLRLDHSALATHAPLSWLPEQVQPGFEDWH